MASNANEVVMKIGKFSDNLEDDIENKLDTVGSFLAGKMVEKIMSRVPPPNSPVTIAIKKSSLPLVDTGEMMGAIDYKQREKHSVDVGVFGTTAEKAERNEYGIGVPERSFIRSTFHENIKGVKKILEK